MCPLYLGEVVGPRLWSDLPAQFQLAVPGPCVLSLVGQPLLRPRSLGDPSIKPWPPPNWAYDLKQGPFFWP